MGSYRFINKYTLKKLIKIILAALLLFSAISMTGILFIFQTFFSRFDKNYNTGYLSYEDVKEQYGRSVITFPSGKNKLKGYIYGEAHQKGLVVIVHGLGGGAESYLAETLYFVDQGWRVFAFDCTGSFGSEGSGIGGLSQALLDLRAALDYIEEDNSLKQLPLMLYGHSMGGYAVTSVLNYDYPVDAVVSVSGFNTPMEAMVERASQYIGVLAYLEYPFLWGYQALMYGDTAFVQAIDGINRSDTPVMIIHGEQDKSVTYDGSGIIAYRDHITNPNVIYKTCSTQYRNDHKNLCITEAAYLYRKEIKEGYQALSLKYHNKVPKELKAGYYEAIDAIRASELNTEFMSSINGFYMQYCATER